MSRRITVDYGKYSEQVLLRFCNCLANPKLTDHHAPFCSLIPSMELLDKIVHWTAMETMKAMEGEVYERPATVTVELPEPGSVGESSTGKG